MYTGPTIQNELFSILLRFRLPKFVFTTDIEKMYRQILIDTDDQKYQLIIWREDPSYPINYYKLNTVTYGTRAAPYLATKSLQKIADENLVNYPLGSQMLQHNFYVDDGLGGSDSLNLALETQKELITILKRHGFNLRKWCANHPQLLKNIPVGDQEVDLDFNTHNTNTIKTLGLLWLPKTDKFCIKVKVSHLDTITKRTATSDLAKLFDPLGLLAPVVVQAKMFIQRLWQVKLGWDEQLPEDLHTIWTKFRTELDNLNNLTIPRHIFKGEVPTKTQLHIFSDASEKAYGAAAYIRATLKDGRVIAQLLCAKTRVAPLKQQTLPRLELCAAVMAAQLARRIQSDHQSKNQPMFFWTDSEIVLSWINAESSLYHTFVANRVSKIQSLTLKEQWRHVRSKENPADILSRGLPSTRLAECSFWFHGPLFLHGKEEMWPPKFQRCVTSNDIEKRKIAVTSAAVSSNGDLIFKIPHRNSFRTLQRIVGYILRFIRNSRMTREARPKNNSLIPTELDDALYVIIKTIQGSDFSSEIEQLLKHKEVNKKSSIASLVPFLDSSGILRVGGRLEASQLSYDAKHPMLIPYNDPLAKLLFIMVHEENNHCGPQALLNTVRQRFWPVKGKITARSTVQKCVRCVRARPQLCSQLMGNLPPNRIVPARPFVNAGVDYCGPFWIHHKVRGKKPTKAYIAVFCCFATKAIHLELVSDLTTEAFIGALKRFISRRGRCQNIYSDNATNFLGARNQLLELSDAIYSKRGQNLIISTAGSKGIQFHFIPPRAPHFGGLWEAAVKSAKCLLLRSVATASLTQEELQTVIVEIEAILNSRPLTPISNDPDSLEALTPGHFLIGEALTSQIDSRATQGQASRLSHWKLLAHLKQEFWDRWSSEYLNQLQQRHKWNKRSPNLGIGDLVVIKEDNLPVMRWPLARVVTIHPGDDGVIRVVEVKTANGIFKRPIHRLALLPVDQDSEETIPTDGNDGTRRASFSASDEEPKAKKKRMLNPCLTLALVTLLLVLPIVLGTPINNEIFGTKLGIHFEGMGSVAVSSTEWQLLIYYDLKEFWSESTMFSEGVKTLNHLCGEMRERSMCTTLVKHFEHTEAELIMDSTLLSGRIHKRAALDLVGNIAHSLFGVLDSEYAKDMAHTISQVNENEAHLLNLLKNQTSIVDSTINILKSDQGAVKTKFDQIDHQISQIYNGIHNDSEEQHQDRIYHTFLSLSIQLTITAAKLQQTQSSLLDVLTTTHHGIISPLILTPQQLHQEVEKIRLHLPESLELPVMQEDALQLYKLMKIKGGLTKNTVIFTINLPLIERDQFELFNLVPIPTWINSTLVSITPCTSLLAVSMDHNRYFTISDTEFISCSLIREGNYLCSKSQILYEQGSVICACEINLFHNETQSDCPVQRIKDTASWIALRHRNKWIYAMPGPSMVTAVCKRKIIQFTLEKSGLLSLEPQCTLKHKFTSIQGQQVISSTLQASYTSLWEVTESRHAEHLMPLLNEIHTHEYVSQIQNLTDLQNSLATQGILQLPNKIDTYNHHHMTIGYLALIITSCILIYLVVKRKSNPTSAPSPAPRSQVATSDFTVHV